MVARSFPDQLRTRPGVAAVLAAVALFSILLYAPTTGFQFVWDDNLLISRNSLLLNSRPLDFFGRGFWAGSPEPAEGAGSTYYRPLTNLSFWLDAKTGGPTPQRFHTTNLLLNALASVLVTLVIWELLRSGIWAALGGLLFAAHSSHVESVAFVSGRTDLLLTVFVGLSAFALLRSLRKRNLRWWLVIVPAFALALLCKETAFLFPVLAALTPLLTRTRYDRRYWLVVGALALVAAGYLLLRSRVVPSFAPGDIAAPLVNRAVGVVNTFGLYVRMFFYPFAHRAKYPFDPAFLNLTPSFIAALLFLVTIPLVALRRRFWVSLWGYGWTILFLLPVSGIVAIGPQAAERLLYLPSAGLAMIAVTLLSRLLNARPLPRQLAGLGLAAVIVLFGADSMSRSRVWQNEATLFAAMVREAPRAPSAYANLADAIAGNHPDSAVGLYNRAISLDQGYAHAYINAAVLLSHKGDHRRAIHLLRVANELRPGSVQVLNNLGLAFLAASQPESALAALERALAIEPNSTSLHVNHAAALAARGNGAAADSALQRLVASGPNAPDALLAIAGRCMELNRPDSAFRLLSRPYAMTPAAAGQLNRLGTMFINLGDSAKAETCYVRALKLDSGLVPALYNQAVLCAARGESAPARTLAARAFRLRPDLPAVRDLCSQLGPDRQARPR